jgi:glycosyltransferase involved in cell wall biosynthesis
MTKELCERLSKIGFDVVVYSLDSDYKVPQKELINSVMVKRYRPLVGDPLFLPTSSFLRDIRREGPAILHVHNLQNVFPLLVSLAKNANQSLIIQPHYHRYGQTLLRHMLLTVYKTTIPKLIFDRARVAISNSSYESKMLREDFKLRKNILSIQEGLPLDELRVVKRHPTSPNRILYVGALRKYKNIDVLMRAFQILLNLTNDPLSLVIVGDGPDKTRLMRLANELGINKHIEWKRNLTRQQLLEEYSIASVFVLLSKLESFSRVVNEAVTVGLPTVVAAGQVFEDLAEQKLVEQADLNRPTQVANAILHARERLVDPNSIEFWHFIDRDEYAQRIAKIYRLVAAEQL